MYLKARQESSDHKFAIRCTNYGKLKMSKLEQKLHVVEPGKERKKANITRDMVSIDIALKIA